MSRANSRHQKVLDLIVAVDYLADQAAANGFPSEVARVLRNLLSARVDLLVRGHSMTPEQWDHINQRITEI